MGSATWTFVITVTTFLLLAGGRNVRAWVIEKSNSGWERWVLSAVVWLFVLFCALYGIIFVDPYRGPDQGPYCESPTILTVNGQTIKPRLGTVTLGMVTFGSKSYLRMVWPFAQISLTIAFLFLNMLALPVLYTILFCFLRKQTRRLLKEHGSTQQSTQQSTQRTTENDPNLETHHAPTEPWELREVSRTGVSLDTRIHPTPLPATAAVQRVNKVSATLLYYPVVYMVLTIPMSVTNIAAFAGKISNLPTLYFSVGMFCSLGFANVILYTSTRKGMIPWDRLRFWKSNEIVTRNWAKRTSRFWQLRATDHNMAERFEAPHMRSPSSKPSASSLGEFKEDIYEDVHSRTNLTE
jgi:hypothetical protein